MNYFTRVTQKEPKGRIMFHRKILKKNEEPDWNKMNVLLSPAKFFHKGMIEEAQDCLQVDFANKLVGGGVLSQGCIQEEIKFITCPEMIVSLLFTAELQDNECLLIKGAERFCQYSGYSNTFEFQGDYEDQAEIDSQTGLMNKETVVMDAQKYGTSCGSQLNQYQKPNLLRELNKAYLSFVPNQQHSTSLSPVATGNWGCGNFGGYVELKSILQIMAASAVSRPIYYYTFEEGDLADELRELHQFLQENKVTVAQLWKALEELSESIFVKKKEANAEMKDMRQNSDDNMDLEESKKDGDSQEVFDREIAPSLRPLLFSHLKKKFSAEANK